MARVFTEGFEDKSLSFFNKAVGGAAIAYRGSRSGIACSTINTTPAYRNITALGEFYHRFCVCITTANELGKIFSWWNGTKEGGSVRLATNGIFTAYSGTTLVGTGFNSFPVMSGYLLVEVHVLMADSNGIINVRINGNLHEINYIGDTKPSSYSTVDNFAWAGHATVTTYFDDFALNDVSGSDNNSWCGDEHVLLYDMYGPKLQNIG